MLSFTEVIPVAIAGAVLGDQFWYAMGRFYATTLLQKVPHFEKKVHNLKSSVIKKGEWIALSGRFVYGGAILFPLTLGSYRYSYSRFTFFDILGVTLWSFVGVLIGFTLGSGTEEFLGKIDRVWHIILLLLFALLGVWFVKRYLQQKRAN